MAQLEQLIQYLYRSPLLRQALVGASIARAHAKGLGEQFDRSVDVLLGRLSIGVDGQIGDASRRRTAAHVDVGRQVQGEVVAQQTQFGERENKNGYVPVFIFTLFDEIEQRAAHGVLTLEDFSQTSFV